MAEMMPELIASSFRNLQLELRAAKLGEKISDFSGDSSRRFHAWIRDIETMGLAVEATDGTMRSLAVQSVRGHAAEFLSRIIAENPQGTWELIKARMTAQFSDESDREIALQKLRKLKQNKGETIQSFGERIRKTARDAYPGQNLENPIISEVLVGTLIEGSISDKIAQKLIRSHPDSFEGAMQLALREQQNTRLFELRRKEEDMEIDAVSSCDTHKPGAKETEFYEKLIARLESLEKGASKPQTPNYRENPTSKRSKPRIEYKWTEDGRPVCNYCAKPGHKWLECKKRMSEARTQTKKPKN